MEIDIYKDFSNNPLLRYCSLSEHSGEEFYHNILNKAFKTCYDKKELLFVNLDYTEGYAPSFLDEAFGNLVYDFSLQNVTQFLRIISNEEPFWLDRIDGYCKTWEQRRIKGESPVVTIAHKEWYRIIDGNIECQVWEQPAA